MRILWIEDFDKSMNDQRALVENLFKDLLNRNTFTDFPKNKKINEVLSDYFKKCGSIHEIEICHNWTEYDSLFGSRLFEFDIFIIDINLSAKGISASEKLIDYPKETFDKYAGFYIYNDIIRRGINEDNISLVTGNNDDLKSICYNNAIPIPNNIFSKGDTGYSHFRAWLQSKANTPYIQLRRGILDACDFFQKEGNLPKIFLNKALKENEDELPREYGLEYLNLLKSFFLKDFVLDEVNKKNKLRTFLLLLSAEWERTDIKIGMPISYYDSEELKSFHIANFWIMKNLRNNLSHFSFTDTISELDAAFFFTIAMRNFFRLELKEYEFETILLNLPIDIKQNRINFNIEEINKENKKALLDICKQKKVTTIEVKNEKGKSIDTPIDEQTNYKDIVFAITRPKKKNDEKDKRDIKKEDLKQYTKIFLYHAFLSEMESYLIKMETPLQNANSKDKLFYKLGAFAFEAAYKK